MCRAIFCGALCGLFILTPLPASAQSPSPYVGQELRQIKALSPQQISDYISGKGMEFAKAAELNGYPGPGHVLELAVQLNLTPDQKLKTEALLKSMQARAISLGKDLVEGERALDKLFASRAVTPEALDAALARIGTLQVQIRQVHLAAHLEQITLLSPEQVGQYNRLRGYGATAGNESHEQRHH